MQRARQEAAARAAGDEEPSRIISRARASLASLRGPAAAAPQQDYHEPRAPRVRAIRRSSSRPIRRAMTMRCTARSNPARRNMPARSGLSGRSLRVSGGYDDDGRAAPEAPRRLVTVAAVLALAVVGTGAAFAYRTYVGSPRSGEPPIIKADNSPTKIVPAPAMRLGKTLGSHGLGRRRREARLARGNAGRRQGARAPDRASSFRR